MKITLSTKGNTVVIDNEGNLSNDKMRRILDVLFDKPQVSVHVESREEEIPEVGSATPPPLDIVLYRQWLRETPVPQVITHLSALTGYDLNQRINNVHSIIVEAPQFATRLGVRRFESTCRWLHANGKFNRLPMLSSLHTYYSAALRNLT